MIEERSQLPRLSSGLYTFQFCYLINKRKVLSKPDFNRVVASFYHAVDISLCCCRQRTGFLWNLSCLAPGTLLNTVLLSSEPLVVPLFIARSWCLASEILVLGLFIRGILDIFSPDLYIWVPSYNLQMGPCVVFVRDSLQLDICFNLLISPSPVLV